MIDTASGCPIHNSRSSSGSSHGRPAPRRNRSRAPARSKARRMNSRQRRPAAQSGREDDRVERASGPHASNANRHNGDAPNEKDCIRSVPRRHALFRRQTASSDDWSAWPVASSLLLELCPPVHPRPTLHARASVRQRVSPLREGRRKTTPLLHRSCLSLEKQPGRAAFSIPPAGTALWAQGNAVVPGRIRCRVGVTPVWPYG
jgi:hypothetical protein